MQRTEGRIRSSSNMSRRKSTEATWTDRFKSRRRDLAKKVEAGRQDAAVDRLTSAGLLKDMARRPAGSEGDHSGTKQHLGAVRRTGNLEVVSALRRRNQSGPGNRPASHRATVSPCPAPPERD